MTLQNVLVIAATNRPDLIDPAVLRPGRFDRRVYVPAPTEEARLKILEIQTKDMPLDDSVSITDLARRMVDYSGADIESVAREAAIHALRRSTESSTVTLADFEDALADTSPSITSDMERWYADISKTMSQREKPPMAIA